MRTNVMKVLVGLLVAMAFGFAGCGGGHDDPATGKTNAANAGPAQNVAVGSLVTLDGSQNSSADGTSKSFRWGIVSKPVGSTAVIIDPTTVAPTFSPDVPGQYLIELVVTDAGANALKATVTVTAFAGNLVPTANAGVAQSVAAGSFVTLDGSASNDANGDLLTYSWAFVSKPNGSSAVPSSASGVNPTFTADLPGAYELRLVVNDGKADSVAATVTITASVPNIAPVANAGVAQSVAAGSFVTLDGSASNDANGDLLTYSWAFVSKPDGSSADPSRVSVSRPTFTADLPGVYVLRLVVNDGKADSVATTVTITASVPNIAPVANAGVAQSVAAGSFVTLDGSASNDANGDLLTYSWAFVSKPNGSSAVPSSASGVNPTFTADLPGAYVLRLVVNDGKTGSLPATVTVTASLGTSGNGKITGRVTDASGAPMRGVTAALYSSSGTYLTLALTDLDGVYLFDSLESGVDKVKFSEFGYSDVWYNGATSESTATSISVTSPNTSNGIDAVLGVGGKITGRVTDTSGTPMRGVNAALYTSSGAYLTLESTDSSGNYTFAGFASGTYKVEFSELGYSDVWYSGATSDTAATPISVVSPNVTSGIDAVMGAGGKITGRVTDALGTPMRGVYAALYTSAGAYLTLESTDSDGNYTFTGFASGNYKVEFSEFGYADVWYKAATSKTTATSISVTSPGTSSGIDAVLGVGGKIKGRVTDALGTPMPGVNASLYTNAGTYLTLESTDSDGSYTFTGFASGSYKIRFSELGYADVWYNGATSDTAATSIFVVSPGTTDNIDVVLGVGGKIEGRVTDASGTPMSGVSAALYSVSGSYLTLKSTDSGGSYSFIGFPSGTYKVEFSKSGHSDVWYKGATSKATATPISITSPNVTDGIDEILN